MLKQNCKLVYYLKLYVYITCKINQNSLSKLKKELIKENVKKTNIYQILIFIIALVI